MSTNIDNIISKEETTRLLLKHDSKFRGFCVKFSTYHTPSDDLYQEFVLSLFRKKPKLVVRDDEDFIRYCYRVIKNTAYDAKRKLDANKRKSHKTINNIATRSEDLTYVLESGRSTNQKHTIDEDMITHVMGETLTKRALDVMNLRVEGFDYSEISNILNMPISAVKSSLFRSRNKLAESLDPEKSFGVAVKR
jgi:RNA polymerase sigma factor (sigma-70 family)